MADNPEVIPFPESGEQPPAGTHRGVLVKAVKNLRVVATQFKDKNGAPTQKPMIEVSFEFTVADKPLAWRRQSRNAGDRGPGSSGYPLPLVTNTNSKGAVRAAPFLTPRR